MKMSWIWHPADNWEWKAEPAFSINPIDGFLRATFNWIKEEPRERNLLSSARGGTKFPDNRSHGKWRGQSCYYANLSRGVEYWWGGLESPSSPTCIIIYANWMEIHRPEFPLRAVVTWWEIRKLATRHTQNVKNKRETFSSRFIQVNKRMTAHTRHSFQSHKILWL